MLLLLAAADNNDPRTRCQSYAALGRSHACSHAYSTMIQGRRAGGAPRQPRRLSSNQLQVRVRSAARRARPRINLDRRVPAPRAAAILPWHREVGDYGQRAERGQTTPVASVLVPAHHHGVRGVRRDTLATQRCGNLQAPGSMLTMSTRLHRTHPAANPHPTANPTPSPSTCHPTRPAANHPTATPTPSPGSRVPGMGGAAKPGGWDTESGRNYRPPPRREPLLTEVTEATALLSAFASLLVAYCAADRRSRSGGRGRDGEAAEGKRRSYVVSLAALKMILRLASLDDSPTCRRMLAQRKLAAQTSDSSEADEPTLDALRFGTALATVEFPGARSSLAQLVELCERHAKGEQRDAIPPVMAGVALPPVSYTEEEAAAGGAAEVEVVLRLRTASAACMAMDYGLTGGVATRCLPQRASLDAVRSPCTPHAALARRTPHAARRATPHAARRHSSIKPPPRLMHLPSLSPPPPGLLEESVVRMVLKLFSLDQLDSLGYLIHRATRRTRTRRGKAVEYVSLLSAIAAQDLAPRAPTLAHALKPAGPSPTRTHRRRSRAMEGHVDDRSSNGGSVYSDASASSSYSHASGSSYRATINRHSYLPRGAEVHYNNSLSSGAGALPSLVGGRGGRGGRRGGGSDASSQLTQATDHTELDPSHWTESDRDLGLVSDRGKVEGVGGAAEEPGGRRQGGYYSQGHHHSHHQEQHSQSPAKEAHFEGNTQLLVSPIKPRHHHHQSGPVHLHSGGRSGRSTGRGGDDELTSRRAAAAAAYVKASARRAARAAPSIPEEEEYQQQQHSHRDHHRPRLPRPDEPMSVGQWEHHLRGHKLAPGHGQSHMRGQYIRTGLAPGGHPDIAQTLVI